jgi:hypothetical protein
MIFPVMETFSKDGYDLSTPKQYSYKSNRTVVSGLLF